MAHNLSITFAQKFDEFQNVGIRVSMAKPDSGFQERLCPRKSRATTRNLSLSEEQVFGIHVTEQLEDRARRRLRPSGELCHSQGLLCGSMVTFCTKSLSPILYSTLICCFCCKECNTICRTAKENLRSQFNSPAQVRGALLVPVESERYPGKEKSTTETYNLEPPFREFFCLADVSPTLFISTFQDQLGFSLCRLGPGPLQLKKYGVYKYRNVEYLVLGRVQTLECLERLSTTGKDSRRIK